jgi:nucleotide-binding universal stress UspA family protein
MFLYQSILVAINPDDEHAQKLVAKAGVIAKQNHAELHMAFVEPGIGNVSLMDIELELETFHDSQQFKRLEQLSELSKHSHYPIRAIHIVEGSVIQHIVELSKKIQANLVVVGTHKGHFHWLGDMSKILTEQLKCDVLTVNIMD